jgi:hypothetical protein
VRRRALYPLVKSIGPGCRGFHSREAVEEAENPIRGGTLRSYLLFAYFKAPRAMDAGYAL